MNELYNLTMENAVLGSILLDKDAIYKVADVLEAEDFYNSNNQLVFKTMLKMFRQGINFDLVILSDELTGKVSSLYLANLLDGLATGSKIKQYASEVKNLSIRRQLEKAGEQNKNVIYDLDKNIENVLAEVQNRVTGINLLGSADDNIKTIVEELEQVQELYNQKYKQGQKYIGFKSGIEKLDDLIDGLRPGHVWVVGAWTSTGKTQFALNIVHNVLEQNIPTAFISLEMSRVDLAARLIGIRHNFSSMKVLRGKNDGEIGDKIEEGKMFLKNVPLEIHTTYFDLEKIKMIIRKDVYIKKTKFVVIDYVQNIISEKGLREYDLMTSAATDLQALARELGITIYIVSQISNESEKGQGAGAGFKGTGALEAVADLAIRIKRDRKKENPDDDYVPIELVISKNRHGFTGVIDDYSMWLKSGKFEKILIPFNRKII